MGKRKPQATIETAKPHEKSAKTSKPHKKSAKTAKPHEKIGENRKTANLWHPPLNNVQVLHSQLMSVIDFMDDNEAFWQMLDEKD